LITVSSWATLAAALGGLPDLPEAACRGRHELFDSTRKTDIVTAIQVCKHCPALQPCQQWAARQRRGRLAGVVAGRRINPADRKAASQ
jgi:hypothetical protein